jgi:SAM-dependent methyltransferase
MTSTPSAIPERPDGDSLAAIHMLSEECARHFDPDSGELRNQAILDSCPACGSGRFAEKFSLYGFKYARCRACRFMFVNPRLNDQGSRDFYNSPFYNALLETEYYVVKHGRDRYYSSSTENHALRDALVETIREIASPQSTVLDMGCGGGALLDLLRTEHGFEKVAGIDLNRRAATFARDVRNLDVVCGDAKTALAERKFEVVLSVETIEHMNDIDAYVRAARGVMTPNALLLITTPRNDRIADLLFGKLADSYMAPNHINFFDEKNLGAVLRRNGLTVRAVRYLEGRMGAGYLHKRFTRERDFVAYDPPFAGPAVVYIPKSFRGDRRQYVAQSGGVHRLVPIESSAISHGSQSGAARLSRRASEVVSVNRPVHMILVAGADGSLKRT